ncbi:MAG: thymidine kinase [Deltaproteobacteria bacterium CG11_big_fil_rev_8_21_14_0_20_49_13]|nr:MAG: thymidine kinase [Deltaproteobacteria bacterium CG11_big_fil_rev_8_21_14_0_20_49_13]
MHHGRPNGWIEVVCGPMFSGKTEELVRRVKLALIAKQRVQVFKPQIDDRYASEYIVSHSEQKVACTPVKNSRDILDLVKDNTRIVGIDEAQFFDEGVTGVCEKLANRGIRVIVAGLDQDFTGRPFGHMPELLAIAESALKLKAVCMSCGGEACKTQRLIRASEQVMVGSGEAYEARCRACHDPDLSLEKNVPSIPVSRKTHVVGDGATRSS